MGRRINSNERSEKENQRIRDRELVSSLMGRELKRSEIVHHAAGGVLILCEDQAQHMLIHQELNALKACGCKSWKKCNFCGEYDDPDNLYINKRSAYHRECQREYRRLERLHRNARYAGALDITGAPEGTTLSLGR